MRPIKNAARPKISRRWFYPIIVAIAAIASGCSSIPDEQSTTSWSGFERQHNAVNNVLTDELDPITAIAASQHPLSRQALQLLGVRYRYGGTSPDNGFDCSGLVHYSAQESLGLKLPRRSVDIAQSGKSIKRTDLSVGDLVFFNTLGARFSHVGIYVGSDKFVHAPSSGGAVSVASMTNPYWKKRFTGARRIDPIMLANR